jgi:hypothetical protein
VIPRDIDGDRNVPFSRIVDARLVYRTLLSSARDVLTAEDIRRVLAATPAALPATAATTALPASAGQPAATTAPTTTPAASSTLSLTDEKKLELLLVYLNRLVDLVFGR